MPARSAMAAIGCSFAARAISISVGIQHPRPFPSRQVLARQVPARNAPYHTKGRQKRPSVPISDFRAPFEKAKFESGLAIIFYDRWYQDGAAATRSRWLRSASIQSHDFRHPIYRMSHIRDRLRELRTGLW